jgi:hypothetical protein
MLGLFDRPADEKVLRALLDPPAIPGLTESFTDLNPTQWRTLLAKLRLHAIIADSASFANSADRFANNFASDKNARKCLSHMRSTRNRLTEFRRRRLVSVPGTRLKRLNSLFKQQKS